MIMRRSRTVRISLTRSQTLFGNELAGKLCLPIGETEFSSELKKMTGKMPVLP